MKDLYKHLGVSTVTLQPSEFRNLKSYQEYLAKTHMGLVEYLEDCFLFRYRSNRLVKGDLANAGYEALWTAATSFHRFGEAFLPYAYTAIKNAMQKEIRKLFPVDLKDAYKSENGFSYGEVFCDAAYEEYETLHYNSWDDEEQRMFECVDDAVEQLPPNDKYIVKAHYGFYGKPLTYQQLGDQTNVSAQAVDKKDKRICRQLRARINADYGYSLCA